MDKFLNRKTFALAILILIGWGFYKAVNSFSAMTSKDEVRKFSKNEILHLEINGVIMNGKKFLHTLKKYQKEDSIKAIVIDINSPGGAVGPSQEIYYEILRAKKETKKPVICVSTGLIASGGYYAALACDQILVAPGAMVGSIGVIMEFANLEKLYDWAKVQRYTITSGKFKDSGSEYRQMRDDERALFQDMINDVYNQFRNTVATARDLKVDYVSQYADGRVMTGSQAVKLKFADVEGTLEDAIRLAAQRAQLGDDYEVFKPKKSRMSFLDIFTESDDDDELNSLTEFADQMKSKRGQNIEAVVKNIFKLKYLNQPLYLMPGYWE